MMKKILPSLFFCFLVCPLLQAKSLEERVKALEAENAQMRSAELERNAKLAQALAQLERLQSELQNLSGALEAQDHKLTGSLQKADQNSKEIVKQLAVFEAQMRVFQTQITKALADLSPKLAEEGELFQKALSQAQTGDFLPAIGTFGQYLKKYPNGNFAGESLWWIAECRFGLANYEEAIKDYQKFVEKYPKSSKVPGVLLKQGKSFLQLQLTEEAKVFLNKLIKEYPETGEAKTAKEELDRLQSAKAEKSSVDGASSVVVGPSLPPSNPPPGSSNTGPLETGDF